MHPLLCDKLLELLKLNEIKHGELRLLDLVKEKGILDKGKHNITTM